MHHSYQAFIFDLDDTLLDTSGCLIEPAARQACAAMIDAGLDAELDAALATRTRLFHQRPREDLYHNLVAHFGVRHNTDPHHVRNIGHDTYFHRDVTETLRLFDGARELLRTLSEQTPLHLVTSGHPQTQQQKIDRTDLAPHFQSVHLVHSSAGQTKTQAFQNILSSNAYQASQVLCIGDRLDREIREANLLSLTTAWVRYGEWSHLIPQSQEETPDHQLDHIGQLRDLLGAKQ